MASRNQWVWMIGMMVAMVAIGQGCAKGPEMAERNVMVTLDDSLARATAVEVNLIGANATEYARLTNRPVEDYWRDVATERAPADRFIMKLSGSDRSRTLSKADPVWQKWREKGAMHLFIIAFIPGINASGVGDTDPRRVILPLDKNRWKDLVDIRVIVSQSGLSVPTQPEPEKKK